MQSLSNKTEKNLQRLASIFNLTIKKGWKLKLANKIGCKQVLLSTWINRDTVPKKQRRRIAEEFDIPEEQWYIDPAYAPAPERIGPHEVQRDSSWDEAGRHDLERHEPHTLFTDNKIRQMCAKRWGNDFAMRDFCEKRQIKAYLAINN